MVLAATGVRRGWGPACSPGVQATPLTPGAVRLKQQVRKEGDCPELPGTAGLGWGSGNPRSRAAPFPARSKELVVVGALKE